MLLVLNIWLCF